MSGFNVIRLWTPFWTPFWTPSGPLLDPLIRAEPCQCMMSTVNTATYYWAVYNASKLLPITARMHSTPKTNILFHHILFQAYETGSKKWGKVGNCTQGEKRGRETRGVECILAVIGTGGPAK
eukprot:8359466-Pyramimonas_sp.AAC.1